MHSASSILLLLLCIVPAFLCISNSSVIISFDSSQSDACALTPCAFNSSSIWVGGVVPSVNDTVNITGVAGPNGLPTVYLPEFTTFNFMSLLVQAATLWVSPNATVNVTFSTVVNNSGSVVVSADAELASLEYLDHSEAYLELAGAFTVEDATITGRFRANDTASFTVTNLYFGSSNAVIEGVFMTPIETITIFPNTNVTFNSVLVNTLTVSDNVTAWFTHIFVMAQLHLPATSVLTIWSGGVIITGTSSGNGTINMYATTSLIFGGNDTFAAYAGNVYVADGAKVWFMDMTLSNLTTDANVLIRADNLVLLNDTVLSGNWMSTGLTANGNLIVNGMLSMLSNSTLSIQKSMTINTPITFENSTVVLAGMIVGDLAIPHLSTLDVVVDNATITGNYVNNGTLLASGDHTLTVLGNATLNNEGDVQVDLTTSHDVVLMVHGYIHVDGKLSYMMVKKPFLKDKVYHFAESVNGTVNGTFVNNTAPALAGSAIDRPLQIVYGANTVDITFDYTLKDVDWWMWVVLGVGIALVLLIIVGIVVKIRGRRHDYETVH